MEFKVGQYYRNKLNGKIVKIVSLRRHPPHRFRYISYKFLDHDIFTVYKLQRGKFKSIYKPVMGYNTQLWKALNG